MWCLVLQIFKENSSCHQRKVCLQRDYYSAGVPKSFLWKNHTELILTDHYNFFVMFAEAICSGWSGGVSLKKFTSPMEKCMLVKTMGSGWQSIIM